MQSAVSVCGLSQHCQELVPKLLVMIATYCTPINVTFLLCLSPEFTAHCRVRETKGVVRLCDCQTPKSAERELSCSVVPHPDLELPKCTEALIYRLLPTTEDDIQRIQIIHFFC